MTRFSLPGTVRTASYRSPRQGGLFIDVTTTSIGYVTAGCIGDGSGYKRLKFQVSKDGVKYNYDLSIKDKPTQFPINMGNGFYTFKIFEQMNGTTYKQLQSVSRVVTLRSEFVPFTLPTAFCDYATDGPCVRVARRLTRKCRTEGAALDAVYKWVHRNVKYDKSKTAFLESQKGYVPSPDATMRELKGVCYDYASLMAAMLRSIGIPCKVITGYMDGKYHAWVSAYADGKWKLCDPTSGKPSGHTYKIRFIF